MIATARLEKPQRYQIFDEDHRRCDRRQVHRTVVYKVAFDMIRCPACRGGNAGGQKGGRGIDGTDRMKTILATGGAGYVGSQACKALARAWAWLRDNTNRPRPFQPERSVI